MKGADRRSRKLVAALLVLLVASIPLALAVRQGSQSLALERRASSAYYGVVQSDGRSARDLAAAGMTRAVLPVSWSRLEPAPGVVDDAYSRKIQARYDAMHRAGLEVVLDAGMQYAPAWVFDTIPDARFVDQYGQEWRGGPGADVPDAVFNEEVRQAQASYLTLLARTLRGRPVKVVRVGGLWNNELHYPRSSFEHQSNAFWAFSPAARQESPVPGYVPGRGSAEDAARFLSWYLTSLNDYAAWQVTTYRTLFGRSVTAQVLLPSWGLRPGDVKAGVGTGLRGISHGERTGALNEGLDWVGLMTRLRTWHRQVELYTTWLDAPEQGPDAAHLSPVRYLDSIDRGRRFALGGENTGVGSGVIAHRTVALVRGLDLSGMMWLDGKAGAPAFASYSRALARR